MFTHARGGFPRARYVGADCSPAGSCVASYVYHEKWSESEVEQCTSLKVEAFTVYTINI